MLLFGQIRLTRKPGNFDICLPHNRRSINKARLHISIGGRGGEDLGGVDLRFRINSIWGISIANAFGLMLLIFSHSAGLCWTHRVPTLLRLFPPLSSSSSPHSLSLFLSFQCDLFRPPITNSISHVKYMIIDHKPNQTSVISMFSSSVPCFSSTP